MRSIVRGTSHLPELLARLLPARGHRGNHQGPSDANNQVIHDITKKAEPALTDLMDFFPNHCLPDPGFYLCGVLQGGKHSCLQQLTLIKRIESLRDAMRRKSKAAGSFLLPHWWIWPAGVHGIVYGHQAGEGWLSAGNAGTIDHGRRQRPCASQLPGRHPTTLRVARA